MDWLFVGDAHFASEDGRRREHFSRLIKKNLNTLHTLVIMGDFFDFWFGFRKMRRLKKEYGDLLELFEELRAVGVRVIYLEGNHDFCMGPYMREKLKIAVYDHHAEIDLDGKLVYLAHGDRVSPTLDHWILTGLLRNRVTYQLISWLGPKIVMAIARRWSTSSRGRNIQKSPEVIARLRQFAVEKIKKEGFDAVILSHTHLTEAIRVKRRGKKEGYYFNVGNWIKDFSYLRYNEKNGFSLEYYPRKEKSVRGNG
jgi:UDP-2,3-diacylglucosamine hydrolase